MYYVYSYLREDYSPYYIGKGSGRRAYTKGPKEVKPPRDKSRLKIIKADLTEKEVFLLEKLYILMFGGVDLGTGILRNKSDAGGSGATAGNGGGGSGYFNPLYVTSGFTTAGENGCGNTTPAPATAGNGASGPAAASPYRGTYGNGHPHNNQRGGAHAGGAPYNGTKGQIIII